MQLLKIRYYQLKRDLGLLFFIIVALASGLSYFVFQHPKQVGWYAVGIIVFLFHNFHQKRSDKKFIYKHFFNPSRQIIQEYQLFLLPLSLPLLFTKYWVGFFILHALILLLPFYKLQFKKSYKFSFITQYFKNDYVFISGIRQKALPLFLCLVLAVLLSPVKLFGIVALMVVNFIILSFYEINESVQLLQSSDCTPKQFINQKFRIALRYFFIINLPFVIINTAFNHEMLWMNLYFLGYNAFLLLAAIVMKYANYNHKKQASNSQMKMVVMFLGLLYPYLIILSFFYFIQSRSEALKNLKQYLDDYN